MFYTAICKSRTCCQYYFHCDASSFEKKIYFLNYLHHEVSIHSVYKNTESLHQRKNLIHFLMTSSHCVESVIYNLFQIFIEFFKCLILPEFSFSRYFQQTVSLAANQLELLPNRNFLIDKQVFSKQTYQLPQSQGSAVSNEAQFAHSPRELIKTDVSQVLAGPLLMTQMPKNFKLGFDHERSSLLKRTKNLLQYYVISLQGLRHIYYSSKCQEIYIRSKLQPFLFALF